MVRFFFLLVGLALFIYVAIQLGPGAALSMLLRVGWGFLTVAVIYSGYQLARAVALSKCVLKPQFASLRNVVGIRISGEAVQFLTFTGPFLAEPTKAWLLKKQGLSAQEGFAATVTEYLIYTFTSAALSLAGLTYVALCLTLDRALLIATLALIVVMVLFLLVSTIAIAFRFYLIGSIIQGIAHLPLVRNRLKPNMETVHRFEDLLLEVLHEHPGRLPVRSRGKSRPQANVGGARGGCPRGP